MIGVSVMLVALVSSVVIGGAAVLLVSLGVRLARSIVRGIRDHPLLRVTAAERSENGPPKGGADVNGDVAVGRTVSMVGCLVAAAVLQLVGMFLPLFPRHLPGRGGWISSYSATPYHAATSWLNLAFLIMLSSFAARRRDRIMAAIIAGYCALTLPSFVTFVAFLPVRDAGPGYYLFGASAGASVVALVIAIGILAMGRSDRGRLTVRGVWLGVLAAMLGAATSLLNSVKIFGQSIWAWDRLPWQSTIAMVAGLSALVLIPLLTLRIADRTAAGMVLGLAAAQSLSATAALLQKLSLPNFNQLTLGFWLTTLDVAILVLLAFANFITIAEKTDTDTSSPTSPHRRSSISAASTVVARTTTVARAKGDSGAVSQRLISLRTKKERRSHLVDSTGRP